MNTYYFPINSYSIAHYFSGACIKAARYFANKPQDIQDRYKDFLLLTSKRGTTETDCCLELVLTEDECKDLIDVKNGWYLMDTKPLPITRIRKIYFANKNQLDTTITNIVMSTAFIPGNMADVCYFEKNDSSGIVVSSDCQAVDQNEKIRQYDRFLGALALMRLAHEPYMNYSENYMETLSFFNKTIARQLKDNCSFSFKDKFQGIFSPNNGFKKIMPYLEQTVNEDLLNRIAKENKQEIKKERISKIIDIESITDTWTYTIAILNEYGVGDESRKKRIDGLIQSNFNALKEGKQEGVALCYGYNRGYAAFTKKYGDIAFKYKLESQLDYYTIESVYQYVFNGIVSDDFPYLDNWCPKLKPVHPKRKTDYIVLDEVIIGKKKAKIFSPEWWNGFAPKFEKAFGTLSKPISEVIRNWICEDVYPDIQDEFKDIIESNRELYEKEVVSLQKELMKLKEKLVMLEDDNLSLQNKLSEYKDLLIPYPNAERNAESYGVAEQIQEETEDEVLKKAVIAYKNATLGDLKNKVKPKLKDSATLKDVLLSQHSLFDL